MACKKCDGDGWVCVAHEETAWDFGYGCCGAPGKACSCNPMAPLLRALGVTHVIASDEMDDCLYLQGSGNPAPMPDSGTVH